MLFNAIFIDFAFLHDPIEDSGPPKATTTQQQRNHNSRMAEFT